MKTVLTWMTVAVLILSCMAGAFAEQPPAQLNTDFHPEGGVLRDLETVIQPDMSFKVEESVIGTLTKENPAEEGISPLTGLPTGEEYTPVALVLDNSAEVFPHWGVADADWIVQVPVRRDGGHRLIAIYGGAYPEQAGGARSGRMTILPVATMFTAAAAFAGWPKNWEENISVEKWIDEWDYNKPIRYYNLLGLHYRERVNFVPDPSNLSAHIGEMHRSLIKRKVKFQKRSFLFTDEPLNKGDTATSVQTRFLDIDAEKKVGTEQEHFEDLNSASIFHYTEGRGYTRTFRYGVYKDRDSGEELTFTNLVIIRCPICWDGNYPYYEDHLRGSGQAEIFQNGKHFTGSWYRSGRKARLVLLDENGSEIRLQRGKTFMIIGDGDTVVSYE